MPYDTPPPPRRWTLVLLAAIALVLTAELLLLLGGRDMSLGELILLAFTAAFVVWGVIDIAWGGGR